MLKARNTEFQKAEIVAELRIGEASLRFGGEVVQHPEGVFGDAQLLSRPPESQWECADIEVALSCLETALVGLAIAVVRESAAQRRCDSTVVF